MASAVLEVSDWLPHIASCADELGGCAVVLADGLNHVGSVCQMNTGSLLAGRPAWFLGSLWLGQAKVRICPLRGHDRCRGTPRGSRNWGTGSCPLLTRERVSPGTNPILFLKPPADVVAGRQRHELELIQTLNERHRRLGSRTANCLPACLLRTRLFACSRGAGGGRLERRIGKNQRGIWPKS